MISQEQEGIWDRENRFSRALSAARMIEHDEPYNI